jgi:Lambda phage tail tube protein, TTP
MATKATSTKAVKVQRGDGGSPTETFTTVAEVTTFKGPTEKAPQLDATSFDSTAMEYIAGLPDNGDLTFDVLFVGTDPQQQGLRTDLRAGTRRNFKIVLNDMPSGGSNPTSVLFAAIVTQAPEIGGGVNAVVKGSVSLRITGTPAWTYAS